MTVERPRRVQVQPFPSNRRLVTAAMRAGRRMAPMVGLVDVDVTKANRLLASHEPPSSLTAFVVASVARAAAAHPDVHAYRNWRGQLVTHRHVDVTTLVEIPTPQGPFGLPHVLRDADVRQVPDLTAGRDNVNGAWAKSRHVRAVPVDFLVVQAIDLDEIQRLLGHASPSSSQVYLHPRAASLRAAVEKVALPRELAGESQR